MVNPRGQDGWLAYIEEATANASDLEQRVHVIELYKRAVGEDPGSLRLWLDYCNYFWHLWRSSNSSDAGWPEEEQTLGRELFTFCDGLDLWAQGYQAIQYRISDSHELWDRWLTYELEQFTTSKKPEGILRITRLYRDRLATPHLTWDETSQAFSSFLSKHDPAAWEKTMQEITASAQTVKKATQIRDPFEMKLAQAQRDGDDETERAELRNYLDWEVRGSKRKQDGAELTLHLCAGLFDRALTGLFALDENVWLDYIVFLSSSAPDFQSSAARLLDASRRSVHHCPWSGQLWARYILCAEEAQEPFAEIESIMQTARSRDALCKDGLEGMIEMYIAWCTFLKRRAAKSGAADEEEDVVGLGLKAAISDVQATGKKLYGGEFQGDPEYRLERLYIQHLTETKDAIADARAQWKKLQRKSLYADSHDFWANNYMWEMLLFSSTASSRDRPAMATEVLHAAATRKTIDWPERVLERYQQHCNSYESSSSVRQAADLVHKMQKVLAFQRKKLEQQQTTQFGAAYWNSQELSATQSEKTMYPNSTAESVSPSGPKRKRESSADSQKQAQAEESASKRHKGSSIEPPNVSEQQPPKRDREHSTVIATNLPFDTTPTAVRKYFKPYGHVNNITAFVVEADKSSATALIEFSSAEEAQAALLRDAKYFGESQISVQPGHDLTVYVTNYPPAADEKFIRDLFKDCGDILSLRWPSLKLNTHRRFCYVSFRDRGASAKAVSKQGKLLQGKYRLVAKYSDPSHKKDREGAVAEGREVHISNLDKSITEAEIRAAFGKYGTVKRVNMPLNMAGKSRGFAFLDFETKDQAAVAAAQLNNIKFKSQILQVEVSRENKVKPTAKTTDLRQASTSPGPLSTDNEVGGPMGEATGGSEAHSSKPSALEIAARTISLMGLPDTVNDARVKAIVEPLGSIVKLVHQPGHGGAIIEFVDAATAGKAALQLNSMEYEGHKLRTGSPDELRQNKPDSKQAVAQTNRPQRLFAPRQVAGRPPLGRPGPKGFRGFAPKVPAATGPGAPEESPEKATEKATEKGTEEATEEATEQATEKATEKEGGPKSNADFRAMFLTGKKESTGHDKAEPTK